MSLQKGRAFKKYILPSHQTGSGRFANSAPDPVIFCTEQEIGDRKNSIPRKFLRYASWSRISVLARIFVESCRKRRI
jgi:hypothetical protein